MGLFQKFNEGGVFMYAILLFGMLSFSFIVERYLALYRSLVQPEATLRKRLLPFVSAADWTGATRMIDSEKGSSLTRIVSEGVELRAHGAGDEEIQARMDEALTREIALVDRRTGFLAMFGNVATLLGLLGTITGMIHSFGAVASANPADRATLLSQGISEAMNCTAFGLIVAIPALVAYAVFQNRTDRFVNTLTSLTTEIFHDLVFLLESDRASKVLMSGLRTQTATVTPPAMKAPTV